MRSGAAFAALVLSVAGLCSTVAASEMISVHEGTSIAVAASPDGRQLALLLQGMIYVMPVQGGEARRITDPLLKVKALAWSPDGNSIAFTSIRDGTYHIFAVPPQGGPVQTLVAGARQSIDPAWAPDGHSLWLVSDVFNAATAVARFDLGTRATKLIEHTDNARYPLATRDGELIYVLTDAGGNSKVLRRGVNGTTATLANFKGRIGPPALSPDGKHLLYVTVTENRAALMLDGRAVTDEEDVFFSQPQWLSPTDYLYTADGKIRHRSIRDAVVVEVPFTASFEVSRPAYHRIKRDFDSSAPRRALGIMRPVESPDGRQFAFAALGDIWLMPRGGKPVRMTNDAYEDRHPAWSPDGRQLLYASDRTGTYQLWLRDMATGTERQLTNIEGANLRASWSPDGKSIVFVHTLADPTTGAIWILDVASGKARQLVGDGYGRGYPVFSGDGNRVLFAQAVLSGEDQGATNQLFAVPASGGEPQRLELFPNHSITKRTADGPVISPDGKWLAFEMKDPISVDGLSDGLSAIWLQAVDPAGNPQGRARRLAFVSPEYLAWSGDGRSLTFLDSDRLRRVEVADGRVTDIPLDLSWTPSKPVGRLVVHAGLLVDGISRIARPNMDIVVDGNRIVAVEPHQPGRKSDREVDASDSTVMPGLIEMHDHQMVDEFGTRFDRLNLAYGVTTVRFVGTWPYEMLAEREVVDSGRRAGPRIFGTGYIFEGSRFYGHDPTVLVSNAEDVAREMERAHRLQYDWVKAYDRLPSTLEKAVVESAHGYGIPVTGHELFPGAAFGKDGVEHINCCTDFKSSALGKIYDDVLRIARQSQIQLTPTIGDSYTVVASVPNIYQDPRWQLLAHPFWEDTPLTPGLTYFDGGPLGTAHARNLAESVVRLYRAGAVVLAGTDSAYVQTPYGISLHGNLIRYVDAGMTPYEALRTATINNANALNLDAGSIQPGKLADLVVVKGNPLENIINAQRVVEVIANGRLVPLKELLEGSR